MNYEPMTLPEPATIEALRHIPGSADDAFRQWVETLPAKHWAKHDLSGVGMGWNAALDAAQTASVVRDTKAIFALFDAAVTAGEQREEDVEYFKGLVNAALRKE